MIIRHRSLLIVSAAFAFSAMPCLASPAPSKTGSNQSVTAREADLGLVRKAASDDIVGQALAAKGLNPEAVQLRLAHLSSSDLHQLASNLEQLQAAGHGGSGSSINSRWVWIGIGVLAAIILVAALS